MKRGEVVQFPRLAQTIPAARPGESNGRDELGRDIKINSNVLGPIRTRFDGKRKAYLASVFRMIRAKTEHNISAQFVRLAFLSDISVFVNIY